LTNAQLLSHIINEQFAVMVKCATTTDDAPDAEDFHNEEHDGYGAVTANLKMWTDDILDEIDGIFLELFPHPKDVGVKTDEYFTDLLEYATQVQDILLSHDADTQMITRVALALECTDGRVPLPLLTKSLVFRLHHLLGRVNEAIKEVSRIHVLYRGPEASEDRGSPH
jgi:hypothetical protein